MTGFGLIYLLYAISVICTVQTLKLQLKTENPRKFIVSKKIAREKNHKMCDRNVETKAVAFSIPHCLIYS